MNWRRRQFLLLLFHIRDHSIRSFSSSSSASSFTKRISSPFPQHPRKSYPAPTPSFLRELDANNPADQWKPPPVAAALCTEGRFRETVDALFKQHGRVSDAVRVLDILDRSSTKTPVAIYLSLFHLCLHYSAHGEAKRVYAHAESSGFDPGVLVSNRLIAMLAKSGCVHDARHVFDRMADRDSYSWNTMIAGYARGGDLAEARRLFDGMPMEERDNTSWSTVMSGYVRHGRPEEALWLYREMQKDGKLESNKFTVSSALAASTAVPCLRLGKEIHGHIVRVGLSLDAVVWSTLSDMYAKCGSIDEARHIFNGIPDRDVVSWTATIGWYFDCGRNKEGFELFSDMLRSEVRPNEFTFTGVLKACSELTMEGLGKQVHGHMVRIEWDPFSFAAGALIDMYSKCGNVESARNAFKGMAQPDLVSWTAMICGLAQNGHPEDALRYFELLLQSGTKPDHVTFVGVLSACTHAGLVDKGLENFHSIEREYGLVHTNDHYACVVDLLSRSGRFKEAEEMINKMPMKPDKFLWASLLGGCRIHGNLRLARLASEALFEIEPQNAATYVTLANIYATAGMWNDVASIRKMMDDRGVVKKPGSSWIEVDRRIHHFLVGDESHPRSKEIYAQLEKLSSRMKEEGYVPDTNFVLHDVEEEQKEQNLAHHSEKLAVAYGIIATPSHTPIKIFKNLRICGDCHTAIKFISRIARREIVVRDSSRFHRFKDGACTCGNYW